MCSNGLAGMPRQFTVVGIGERDEYLEKIQLRQGKNATGGRDLGGTRRGSLDYGFDNRICRLDFETHVKLDQERADLDLGTMAVRRPATSILTQSSMVLTKELSLP